MIGAATTARRERARRKAVRRVSRRRAIGCGGLLLLASVMLGLTLAGGTTLLVQVTGVIVGSLIVWSILRRLMRGSPRDTSPLKQRTRQIDPALSMQFRPDDWRGT